MAMAMAMAMAIVREKSERHSAEYSAEQMKKESD